MTSSSSRFLGTWRRDRDNMVFCLVLLWRGQEGEGTYLLCGDGRSHTSVRLKGVSYLVLLAQDGPRTPAEVIDSCWDKGDKRGKVGVP